MKWSPFTVSHKKFRSFLESYVRTPSQFKIQDVTIYYIINGLDIPLTDFPSKSIEKDAETKSEQQVETQKTSDWPWKRARKVAVMISFSGKDYLGMQR
jgi:hypothetical protein